MVLSFMFLALAILGAAFAATLYFVFWAVILAPTLPEAAEVCGSISVFCFWVFAWDAVILGGLAFTRMFQVAF